jgi:hypothetical protein
MTTTIGTRISLAVWNETIAASPTFVRKPYEGARTGPPQRLAAACGKLLLIRRPANIATI